MIDVCNMQDIKYLLAKYNFHFSKSKGQNFLTQRWVPERIVSESGIDRSCCALEIGPGFGPLTQELCRQAGKVIALELDTSLKPVLQETVGSFDNLEIIFTDGSMLSIDTNVVEKDVAENMYQRSELDWLIYNAPLEYARMGIQGKLKEYVQGVPEHRLIG